MKMHSSILACKILWREEFRRASVRGSTDSQTQLHGNYAAQKGHKLRDSEDNGVICWSDKRKVPGPYILMVFPFSCTFLGDSSINTIILRKQK